MNWPSLVPFSNGVARSEDSNLLTLDVPTNGSPVVFYYCARKNLVNC
jgi:hypothetical protein